MRILHGGKNLRRERGGHCGGKTLIGKSQKHGVLTEGQQKGGKVTEKPANKKKKMARKLHQYPYQEGKGGPQACA